MVENYNDRQTFSFCLNFLCISSHFLSVSHTSLEMLGGRPWPSYSRLVPTRKQLIMCERLSECLLSGQQQHSAIYLPSRQNSQPAHHAGMHSLILTNTHTHTHTHTDVEEQRCTLRSAHTHCKIMLIC